MTGVALRALRYRSGQAVAVLVLSTVAVAACAFGPFYQRSVGQAQVRATLTQALVTARSITVSSTDPRDQPLKALDVGEGRKLFGAAIASQQLTVTYAVGERAVQDSLLLSRNDQCNHLTITAGRCATAANEVVVSTSAAKALTWRVGDQVTVSTQAPGYFGAKLNGTVKLVGFYAPYDPTAEYWFGHAYWTAAGIQERGGDNPYYIVDPLIAGAGFDRNLTYSEQGYRGVPVLTRAELPLRAYGVQLDELRSLSDYVAAVQRDSASSGLHVDTDLPALLAEISRGQRQAATVVPGFALELALLVLVVIGLVVAAAAEQRRPEFALARLRGRSQARAARLLVRELAPVLLLGVVPGFLLAWALAEWASRHWLGGVGAPELRWPVLAAVGAVLVVQLAIVWFVARRVARAPVQDMLRRVPPRTSRVGVGTVEAALAAAAIGGVVVVLSGDQHNLLAVVTPGLIALVVGLVLSRILVAVVRRSGQRALWRGDLSSGLASVQAARRPATRRVVTLVCVAAALIVSAADQSTVAAQNRAVRADVEAGAPVVLDVQANGAQALFDAVSAGDASGRYATAVILQRPVNAGSTVLAVDPGPFGRIARWGWDQDRPTYDLAQVLDPPRPGPVTVAGTALQLQLASVDVVRHAAVDQSTPSKATPIFLTVELRGRDGSTTVARLGPLPEGRGQSAPLNAAVPCASGCTLTQFSLIRGSADLDLVEISAPIGALQAGTAGAWHAVDLGAAGDWQRTSPELSAPMANPNPGDPATVTQTIGMQTRDGHLVLSIVNAGTPAVLQQLHLPAALPALVAGAVSRDPNAQGYLDNNNIDGFSASFEPVGTLPLVPGADGPALLVDGRVAASIASPSIPSSQLYVWLASDDPPRERALVTMLAQHGATVFGRDSQAAHLAALEASSPAWAMRLALLTAILAALLAGLVMIVSAVTTRRGRAYDLAALRLAGVPAAALRRASVREQVSTVLVAVVVGAVVGLIGAHLALPSIPIFVSPADVPAVRYPVAWLAAVLAAAATVVVLAAIGAALGRAVVRRTTTQRLREGAR